ncbi:MAG: ABC transporter permease subunit [Pseudomonadota bacterium]
MIKPKHEAASALDEHVPANAFALRQFRDRMTAVLLRTGGGSVLLAILLIFLFLLYQVAPLFSRPSIEAVPVAAWADKHTPIYLSLDHHAGLAFTLDQGGQYRFITLDDGQQQRAGEISAHGAITALASAPKPGNLLAIGHDSGHITLVSEGHTQLPAEKDLLTPGNEWPLDRMSVRLGEGAVRALGLAQNDDTLSLVAQFDDQSYRLLRAGKSAGSDWWSLNQESGVSALPITGRAEAIYIDVTQRWLIILDADARFQLLDIAASPPARVETGHLFQGQGRLSASAILSGGLSLLAASDEGVLAQFFMANERGKASPQAVRLFAGRGPPSRHIEPFSSGKTFLSVDESGALQLYHATAQRQLLIKQGFAETPGLVALTPAGDHLLRVDSQGNPSLWRLHNPHPEVSWSALWGKVWYEGYAEPARVWQSSGYDAEFEPKFSLAPLAFGTLKAAFYTMVLAIPLALGGAVYTAYFMAPAMRRKVKPMIELMEALPTVVLGFLAALWLAPLFEAYLGAFLVLLPVLGATVLLMALLARVLPVERLQRSAQGWHSLLLIPPLLLASWACFSLNGRIEDVLFAGDARAWVSLQLGLDFSQRNAIVLGIALGMAVTPSIFSIAEDAIFSVPRHLSDGSLALGATPWQTLVGVVLPMASPGVFSGVMIGLGRAVGETMIMLMVTGNTPIMEINPLEGLRSLSASIAIEAPEVEPGATHYRVLFLAALVLFLFTFAVNTLAELVRQRLRLRFGAL